MLLLTIVAALASGLAAVGIYGGVAFLATAAILRVRLAELA